MDGTIAEIDDDGDALIDFPRLARRVWILQKDFEKLEVAATLGCF